MEANVNVQGQPSLSHQQQPIRNREFRLYAPRVVLPSSSSTSVAPPHHHHQQPIAVSESAAAAYGVDQQHGQRAALKDDDAAPQIPPLAVSPRWDSLANGSLFITSPLTTSFESLHEEDEDDGADADDEEQPHSGKLRIGGGSSSTFASPSRVDTAALPRREKPTTSTSSSTPQSPTRHLPSEGRPRADSVQHQHSIENFSRPRKTSGRQPVFETRQQRQPGSPLADPTQDLAMMQVGLRSRGQSVSSAKSNSTFASIPLPPAVDFREARGLRSRDGPTAPPSRAPVQYRVDSGLSGYAKDGAAPWLSAEETRSSFRSQRTASTAPGTTTTERSSVLTKKSSATSLYANDEPSVEDVMCMYETGFGDDEYQSELDSRPLTAWSEPNKRAGATLDDGVEDNPMPTLPLPVPRSGLVVRDSTAIFRNSDLPSSLPKDVSHIEVARHGTITKRDSAKSLDSDGSAAKMAFFSDRDSLRDRYGFKKENQYVSKERYDGWNDEYSEYLARRRRKWVAYLRENGLMTDQPNRFPQRSTKTKRFVRKGIPPDWRGAAWFFYAGGPEMVAKNAGVYERLVRQTAKEVDVEAIERDLHRTFPDNVKFKPHGASHDPTEPSAANGGEVETPTISSLRRVLHAFSIHNPKIGYCQSLNFLAGLLLLFVETEEHCFWLLNIITTEYLPGTHEHSLEGSKVDLGVLMTSLQESMPSVFAKVTSELEEPAGGSRPSTANKGARRAKQRRRDHLHSDRLPAITLTMTAWFMSCFIGTLPIETTLRVWDVLFYEGSKTLFRIALAIFKLGESEIDAVSDPMEMFSVVQSMPRRLVDTNVLMEACFKRRNGFGHLSQETTEARRQERRMLMEKEKQAADGNVTDAEAIVGVRRKGTLFGRKKREAAAAGRPAEV